MLRLDLHMHSNVSNDGNYSPAELMTLCKNAGITVAALTDHNSVRGVPEAVEHGRRHGIEVIPAIEIDCTYEGGSLHLLGYGIDPYDHRFIDLENSVQQQERDVSSIMMEKVRSLGIFFEYEAVMNLAVDGIVTGEMIAEVSLADKRNSNSVSLQPYRPDRDRSDNPYVNFYWDFCSSGKPGHVPIRYIHLTDGVRLITESGGIPILAHPHKNIGLDEDVFVGILSRGTAGVEVYSSYHNDAAVLHFERMANKYGLLVTAGSDFHGKTKPSVNLGGHGYEGKQHDILQPLRSPIVEN